MKLNKLCSTLNMSHEEWLQQRRKGIGGSDAGALCGVNSYASPVTVFLDKTGKLTEKEDSEAMRVGRDLEEYVAKRFTEATGKKARRANSMFYHEEYPFMLANVDRLVVGENAGLECKTTSSYGKDKWKDGKIPESYEIQCHHYMAVTGADRWYIACLIGNSEFVWRKIERDEELIQSLIRIESDFWNQYVLAGVAPPPDGSEASERIIRERYPDSDPDLQIPLQDELEEKLDRSREIDTLLERLTTEKKEIYQQIQEYMGAAEKASGQRYSVSWKSVLSNRLDSKALKSSHPDIYKQFVKQSSSRRFTVKEV